MQFSGVKDSQRVLAAFSLGFIAAPYIWRQSHFHGGDWSAPSVPAETVLALPMPRGIQAVLKPGGYPRSFPTRFALLSVDKASENHRIES